MCIDCWNNNGSPANWSPDIAEALRLTYELYQIHSAGGPLHVALDDCNLDGVIVPWYDGWSDTELDELYDGGWRIADLPPEAPVVVEGLGRSTRQLCDELAARLNAMPYEDRVSMRAYYAGLVALPDDGLLGEDYGLVLLLHARHAKHLAGTANGEHMRLGK